MVIYFLIAQTYYPRMRKKKMLYQSLVWAYKRLFSGCDCFALARGRSFITVHGGHERGIGVRFYNSLRNQILISASLR